MSWPRAHPASFLPCGAGRRHPRHLLRLRSGRQLDTQLHRGARRLHRDRLVRRPNAWQPHSCCMRIVTSRRHQLPVSGASGKGGGAPIRTTVNPACALRPGTGTSSRLPRAGGGGKALAPVGSSTACRRNRRNRRSSPQREAPSRLATGRAANCWARRGKPSGRVAA